VAPGVVHWHLGPCQFVIPGYCPDLHPTFKIVLIRILPVKIAESFPRKETMKFYTMQGNFILFYFLFSTKTLAVLFVSIIRYENSILISRSAGHILEGHGLSMSSHELHKGTQFFFSSI
jgi:hypothetical protein